jgi:hypothetical protein
LYIVRIWKRCQDLVPCASATVFSIQHPILNSVELFAGLVEAAKNIEQGTAFGVTLRPSVESFWGEIQPTEAILLSILQVILVNPELLHTIFDQTPHLYGAETVSLSDVVETPSGTAIEEGNFFGSRQTIAESGICRRFNDGLTESQDFKGTRPGLCNRCIN